MRATGTLILVPWVLADGNLRISFANLTDFC
jgi:hypothetical protein